MIHDERPSEPMPLREKIGCVLIGGPVLLLATGWLFLDVRTWLSAVGTLFLVSGVLYRFVRPAEEPRDGD